MRKSKLEQERNSDVELIVCVYFVQLLLNMSHVCSFWTADLGSTINQLNRPLQLS